MIKSILPLGLPFLAILIIIVVLNPAGFTGEKISGLSVSAGLWLIGYSLLRWAEDKNFRILLGILLGGILFRACIVILSILFVQKFTELVVIEYVISLMIFYLACEFALVFDYVLRKN